MADFGRILGVDVGSKRVGLARTDFLRTVANPIGAFSPKNSFIEIKKQIQEYGPVKAIVVGWPLTPQGASTHATRLAEEYLKALNNKFKGIELYTMDERYSSRQAMDIMVESGVPKKKRHRKGRLDQVAASVILTNFLEAHPEI